MVAEDDSANYYYIERMLRKTDAIVFHAGTGKQAVQIMKENPNIKMVLMDIKMPEMNGIDALKEIRNLKFKIPVIAQTAYAFADEIHRIKASGFVDYLIKPINPKKFYDMLSKYLA